MKRAALFQMVLAGAVLLGCLALPRPGGAVLLIRVPGSHNWPALSGHVAVLRAGVLPGSLLVRIEGEVPVVALLHGGFIPLAAPGILCASSLPTTPQI